MIDCLHVHRIMSACARRRPQQKIIEVIVIGHLENSPPAFTDHYGIVFLQRVPHLGAQIVSRRCKAAAPGSPQHQIRHRGNLLPSRRAMRPPVSVYRPRPFENVLWSEKLIKARSWNWSQAAAWPNDGVLQLFRRGRIQWSRWVVSPGSRQGAERLKPE